MITNLVYKWQKLVENHNFKINFDKMEKWSNSVAVVTGASSGIGAAIAQKLVKNGLTVIGLARRVERIEKMAKSLESEKGRLHGFKCDLTKRDEIQKVFETIDKKFQPISILINNAGIARKASLIDGPIHELREVVEVNLIAVFTCSIWALRSMKKGSIQGHIININSVAGHVALSFPLNIYSATKFGVTAYTEALRRELRDANLKIKMTSISPGSVETEFVEAANLSSVEGDNSNKEDIPTLYPNDIAEAVEYTLKTPSHVQVYNYVV